MPNTRIYWLHTLSPTHAGIGRGIGYIDLPIDRDGVTGWPIIRGSSFKGVWADHHRASEDERKRNPLLSAAFGKAGDENDSNAGSLIATDAKIVCLPVRSFRGTFAWVTSPLCLQMVSRTLSLAGLSGLPQVPEIKLEDIALTTKSSGIVVDKYIYLEDLDFKADSFDQVDQWAELIAGQVFEGIDPQSSWKETFKKRFVVLPDQAFDFLCETGTEVNTRIRINEETKTVVQGALWTEESLPTESILMGVIQCDRVFDKDGEELRFKPEELLKKFVAEPLDLQIGGKATIGRGQVRCIFREAK